MSKRLGLIFPRFRYPSGDIPLGIATLAAHVQSQLDVEVAVCDTTFHPRLDHVEAFLDRFQPDVVGVGMSTIMVDDALAVCRLAHRRGIPVFVGGPHPTIDPEGVLADLAVDAAVVGEGELTTVDLVRSLLDGRREPVEGAWVRDRAGEIHRSDASRHVQDLDSLPFPAWDSLDMEAYFAAWDQLSSFRPGLRGVNLVASRGCPFQCSFCQPMLDQMFGKKFRTRSPGSVVAEVVELHRRFAIDAFWFADDTLTLNRAWVEEFCDGLIATGLGLYWGCTTRANLVDRALLERLHASGLRKIGVGLESSSERIREGIYRKGVDVGSVDSAVRAARDLGIHSLVFLMLGAPGETRTEMLHSIDTAARLPASDVSISLFVPIPGTSIHERMVQDGYELSSGAADYDYYARQPFRGEVSLRQLRAIQLYGYSRFYLHPARLRSLTRSLSSSQGARGIGRKLLRLAPAAPWSRVSGK